jgi:4-hydroxybenzoate polyprenyltransferase
LAASRDAKQLTGEQRELIYISLLAGFASGLAAALDRGLFALLFAAAATLTAYAAFRQAS